MKVKENKGITLIVLIITIIVLLILAGISIASLTGDNGVLSRASKAKDEHLIEQYKEEINLIIADEIAERKTENKEKLMIVSLDSKIRKKEWVRGIYKCNEEKIEQSTFEESNHLLVESKEHYEFFIEINEAKQTAQIINFQKGTGEKYTVTYDPNGGEGSKETIEVRQGFSVALKECNYTREKYKFVGWCENQNGEGERYLGNSPYSPDGQVTLYAIWELNVITVTLDSNDGTGRTKQLTVEKRKDAKLPVNVFTRSNYTFFEWNSVADGNGEKYEEGATINFEDNITLYAIWKINITQMPPEGALMLFDTNNPTEKNFVKLTPTSSYPYGTFEYVNSCMRVYSAVGIAYHPIKDSMWSGTIVSTKKVINTRKYKKMCVSISSICLESSVYYDSTKLGITKFVFGLSNNAGEGATSVPGFLVEEQLKSPSNAARAKFTTAGTYTLDISQFQGDYFVLLRVVTSTYAGQMGDIQIDRIWLE